MALPLQEESRRMPYRLFLVMVLAEMVLPLLAEDREMP